nr:proline hydroxylase buaE-like isoform X3 [Procambarus clarkii]
MLDEDSQHQRIPLVDLGQLGLERETEPSQEVWQRVAQQLHQAFADIGCAYLTNHGVPDDQLRLLYNSAAEFFGLDQTKKASCEEDPSKHRGYIRLKQERDEGTEELHESFIVETAEDVFPDADVPSFRSSVLSVLDSCRVLSSRLLTALAISLGKDPDYFQLLHQGMGTRDSPSCLRINYYPPLPRNLTEETTRFVAHVDFSTITLLFQADTGGLQEHQVVIPTEEHGRRSSRTSVGYFAHADNHVPMKPAGSSSPSRSDPSLTVQEYFNGFVHKRLQI